LWSYPVSGPPSALMSAIAHLNLLLIKTWSIWFAVLPSAEYIYFTLIPLKCAC
jgi:uncharacterized membrane protein (DUF2068 family)